MEQHHSKFDYLQIIMSNKIFWNISAAVLKQTRIRTAADFLVYMRYVADIQQR